VHNLDLEITGELSPFFGHRTSPLWKMSTLVSKKSVSRKGGTPIPHFRVVLGPSQKDSHHAEDHN
jgi:hypothetical protein